MSNSPEITTIATGYSENQFESMAKEEPSRLLWLLIDGSLTPPDITFAAEIAGRLIPGKDTLAVLAIVALSAESPLSREGAVLGLAHRSGAAETLLLKWIAANDKCEAVRQAAAESIE